MRKIDLKINNFYNVIILILTIILLTLTINTLIILFKLQQSNEIPKNSIRVSPKMESQSLPTFNKNIEYLGNDLSLD